jgi:hypothetical protein
MLTVNTFLPFHNKLEILETKVLPAYNIPQNLERVVWKNLFASNLVSTS